MLGKLALHGAIVEKFRNVSLEMHFSLSDFFSLGGVPQMFNRSHCIFRSIA